MSDTEVEMMLLRLYGKMLEASQRAQRSQLYSVRDAWLGAAGMVATESLDYGYSVRLAYEAAHPKGA